MEKSSYLCAIFLAVSSPVALSGPLEDCAEQFIDGLPENSPTLFSSAPTKPYGDNVHLCYRDDDVSFFATEYWPKEFAPRWAAYKLDPANYGVNGCNTFTRAVNNCYIKAPTWEEAVSCTNKNYRKDPFHRDHMLVGEALTDSAFASTGHDRGHIAPRNAFSWHVCGTYQTFSMANMSPQRAFLNQDIWMYLEKQVLTWAADEGPVYVVTGTTFRKFPYQRFQVFLDGKLDPAFLYRPRQTLYESTAENKKLLDSHPDKNDLLRPKRNQINPDKVKSITKNMRMPTGYFKVIYRPAMNGENARAIGFLLPHTYENLNELTAVYGMDSGTEKSNEDFWFFRSRIDLIEEVSGISFPGIPMDLKNDNRPDWWTKRKTARDIRGGDCGRGTPAGVLENSTKEQRLAACVDVLMSGN